jgi:hypothetical protein
MANLDAANVKLKNCKLGANKIIIAQTHRRNLRRQKEKIAAAVGRLLPSRVREFGAVLSLNQGA